MIFSIVPRGLFQKGARGTIVDLEDASCYARPAQNHPSVGTEKAFMTTKTQLEQTIRAVFAEVYAGQSGGAPAPELADASVLLDTGLDSLGFAILVTRLEEDLGFDPFSLATEAYYPTTFREFVDFYAAHQPV